MEEARHQAEEARWQREKVLRDAQEKRRRDILELERQRKLEKDRSMNWYRSCAELLIYPD